MVWFDWGTHVSSPINMSGPISQGVPTGYPIRIIITQNVLNAIWGAILGVQITVKIGWPDLIYYTPLATTFRQFVSTEDIHDAPWSQCGAIV